MWFVSFYRTYGYLNSLTKNQDEARLTSGALPVAWLVCVQQGNLKQMFSPTYRWKKLTQDKESQDDVEAILKHLC